MQSFDEWLKLVHILAAMTWIGGASTLVIMSMRLSATGDAATMRSTALHGEFMGRAIYTPAAILALASGVWMVARIDFFDWADTWIAIGFAGIAWGAATGIGFFGPQLKALAADVDAHGPEGQATQSRMSRITTFSWIDLAVLAVVVWAMVTKPGI